MKAHLAGDDVTASQRNAEADKWADGGIYRIGLHTVVGGLTGGADGALGAAASSAAAPAIDVLQSSITQSLVDSGMSRESAESVSKSLGAVAAGSIGAIVGGGTGAATALNEDINNRQLHISETKRIKELAKGNPEKESKLIAAACALVHCADGVPKDDPQYSYLAKLQAMGDTLTDEKNLLSSQKGWEGRSFGALFTYSGVDEYIIDPARQNRIPVRLEGAVQATGSTLGLAGDGLACTTGIGCAAAAVTGTVLLDNLVAGANKVVTGQSAQTYGEQVLQSLGMSPGAAALTYATIGLAPSAGASALNIIQKAGPQLDALLLNTQFKLGQNIDDVANTLAASSTRQVGSTDKVILGQFKGEYDGYIGQAKLNGGVWYETDKGVWDKLTKGLSADEQVALAWKVNESFLTQQMQKGASSIVLSGEDAAAVLVARPNSFTASEIRFLDANASKYGYVRKGNEWVRE